jgi:hypothetical protein
MTTIKRITFALFVTLLLLAPSARAQTPAVSTVNVTPGEQKVRVSSVGDVLDMHVAVSDESGDVVFESGPVAGDGLDWEMRDPQGRRVPPGTYNLTVTYRTSSGKVKRRVEQVLVTEEAGKAEAQAPATSQAALGAITGAGTANKVAKFTGTYTVGDSAIFESGGKVGVGTTAPQQSIHVVSASSRLRLQSTGGASLTTTEYVTNGRVWQSGAGGSTAANGVANKFFVFDQTANQFRLVLDPLGNFGVGTTTPTSKLTVNGGIEILGTGNGIKFPDGSIQTKATSGTINGTGTTNRLAKFTGPNSFGNSTITEASGNVGINKAAPVSKLHVVSAASDNPPRLEATGTTSFAAGWDFYHGTTGKGYVGVPGTGTNFGAGELILFGGAGTKTSLWAGGNRAVTILTNGTVGIGTDNPIGAMLHVISGTTAVSGEGTVDGVQGFSTSSTNGAGIFGSNTAGGYAGYFNGRVKVDGALTVNSCTGCTIQSDQNLKTNFSTINPRLVLDRLSAIPIKAWNYKSDEPAVRHIGPMAQDFRAAFSLGADDKHIDMIDANGVTMAAIQGLYQQNQGLLRTVERQAQQSQAQSRQIEQLRERLVRVERAVKKRRAARRH